MYIPIDHIMIIALICLGIGLIAGMIIGFHLKTDKEDGMQDQSGNYERYGGDPNTDPDEHTEWWDYPEKETQEHKPDMLKKQAR